MNEKIVFSPCLQSVDYSEYLENKTIKSYSCNSSPASYWLLNYLCDLIIALVWFCYLLAFYCLFDVAFNGLSSTRSSLDSTSALQFASPWDLRVQFYPLTFLIVLPTLPFAYLLTKLFRSDILVSIYDKCHFFKMNLFIFRAV